MTVAVNKLNNTTYNASREEGKNVVEGLYAILLRHSIHQIIEWIRTGLMPSSHKEERGRHRRIKKVVVPNGRKSFERNEAIFQSAKLLAQVMNERQKSTIRALNDRLQTMQSHIVQCKKQLQEWKEAPTDMTKLGLLLKWLGLDKISLLRCLQMVFEGMVKWGLMPTNGMFGWGLQNITALQEFLENIQHVVEKVITLLSVVNEMLDRLLSKDEGMINSCNKRANADDRWPISNQMWHCQQLTIGKSGIR